MAFDASDNLWIPDYENNRILMFCPPFSDGMVASLVIGQSSFTTSLGWGNATASSLYAPSTVSFDSIGNLWVGDSGNNRILAFYPSTTTVPEFPSTVGAFTTLALLLILLSAILRAKLYRSETAKAANRAA